MPLFRRTNQLADRSKVAPRVGPSIGAESRRHSRPVLTRMLLGWRELLRVSWSASSLGGVQTPTNPDVHRRPKLKVGQYLDEPRWIS
jgi:hypothetical protein